MIQLVRGLAWLAFTAAMSFVFLVMLDYGPARFPQGMAREVGRVRASVVKRLKAPKIRAAPPAKPAAPAGAVQGGGAPGN